MPIPDVIVAIDGCYYAHQNAQQTFPVELFSYKQARLVLVSCQKDDVCQPWQSQKAAAALKAAGFETTTVIPIPDANHYQPIFHDLVNGKWLTLPDSPAGHKTVPTILDAIGAASWRHREHRTAGAATGSADLGVLANRRSKGGRVVILTRAGQVVSGA